MDLEKDLNREQLAAVTHGEGPQLVLAGAGSGKTRVITYRIAWLIHERGVDPASIVAVTFTNKAANEMKERVEALVGIHPLPAFVGTFHRFALRMLRRWGPRVGVPSGFVIFDTDDQIALVKQALKLEKLDQGAYPPRTVLSTISGAKNRLQGPGDFAADANSFFYRKVAAVYARYQELLEKASGVDFDDMLRFAVELLEEHDDVRARVRGWSRHMLVDEYQDTNHCQLQLILQSAGAEGNLTAVGDEDQSIYRWRGAELDNILRFEKSFPGAVVRKLERNYRSTQRILTAASELVAHNAHRRGKTLWTEAGEGEPIQLYTARDEQDEARWIVETLLSLRPERRLEEMAVLVRTNALTRALEEELIRRQVPYTLVAGVRFYERAEIKDLVAYLRLIRNPGDDFSLMRVINQPTRGIGKTTQDRLLRLAAEEEAPVWEVIRRDDEGELPPRSAAAVRRFRKLVERLRRAAEGLGLYELLEEILDATGYEDLYKKDDPEMQARLENIRELLSAAREFTEEHGLGQVEDDLGAFLDHISLVSDIDTWNPEQGVSLMTLHSAKGLEFPVVAVAGLEDGLLPHFNAGSSQEEVEEERRLLYVGMTRARRRLLLSRCRRRRIAGRYQSQEPSPFLKELPIRCLRAKESPDLFGGPRVRGVYRFFGDQGRSGRPRRPSPGRAPSSSSPQGPRKGRRVRHPDLGTGVILATEGSGDELKLTVYFDEAGKRKLIAKYAGLEML